MRVPGLTRRASRRAVGRDTSDLADRGRRGRRLYDANVPHRRAADDRRDRHQATSDLPGRSLGRIARRAGRGQPGRPRDPAGATYNATEAQYEEAVEAAVARLRGDAHAAGLRARRGSCARSAPAFAGRREELGRLIALESGKPIRDALVEVDRAALTFRLGAEEAERMTGETIPLDLHAVVEGPGGHHPALPDRPDRGHQPVQLPAQPGRPQARRRRSPAGSPIVLKPPSKDPLTMLTVAEIIEEAGVPGRLRSPSCR